MMPYLIGQTPRFPCVVCSASPVPLQQVPCFPQLAQCARCGMPYVIKNEQGDDYAQAQVAVSPGFQGLFQAYYRETGRRMGLPAFMLDAEVEMDAELLERTRAMDEWLHEHPELVAAAAAPQTYPYASVTVVVIEHDDGLGWSVLVPPSGLSADPMIPFSPDNLPIGTVVTIQIPIRPGDVRDGEQVEEEGHA